MIDYLTDIKNRVNSYEDAVSFIQSIPRFSASNILPEDRFKMTSDLYEYLKKRGLIEERDIRVFHIAGTNGKGSVCAFLHSMHKTMGFKTGVFTSPHLTDIRERIVADDEMISKEDFYESFMTVASACEEFKKNGKYADYVPVYFDWLFFTAAVYFSRVKPDAIIWETGLGGSLDSTNVIGNKSVAVITEIGMDHMEILGNDIESIAAQKAGIITSAVPVVTVDKTEAALDVIKHRAEEFKASLTVVPDHEHTAKKVTDKRIDFSYKSRYYNNATLAVVGHAAYQTENASLALAAMECVYPKEMLTLDVMRKGLLSMKWAGRMEKIEDNVFFDGAHNFDGIDALLESVGYDGCRGRRYMLFSAVSDKQADLMLESIASSGLFYEVGLTPIHNDRSVDEDTLRKLSAVFDGSDTAAVIYDELTSAYDAVKEGITKEDVLYVCGSLYLVGELKAYIDKKR